MKKILQSSLSLLLALVVLAAPLTASASYAVGDDLTAVSTTLHRLITRPLASSSRRLKIWMKSRLIPCMKYVRMRSDLRHQCSTVGG